MSIITYRDTAINYEVYGRGRPLIIVSGLFDSVSFWIDSMVTLGTRFRVYCLNLWGGNEKNTNDLFKFNIETYVTLLEGFTESLGINNAGVGILGLDVGSVVALLFAARHEWADMQRYQVVAINTPMNLRDFDPRFLNALHSLKLTREYLSQAEGAPIIKKLAGFNLQAVQHSIQSLTMLNMYEITSRIQAPIVMVYGEGDRIISPPNAGRLASRGNISLVSLPDSRHFPMLDNKTAFQAFLTDKFLEPASGRPASQQSAADTRQSPAELTSATARIFNRRGQVVGAGFLVGKNMLVTCAHIVEPLFEMEAREPNPVQVDFPQSEGSRDKLDASIYKLHKESDIAILVLKAATPQDAHPLRLLGNPALRGHSFRTIGFPSQYQSGAWSGGMILDRTDQGWVQIEGEQIGHRISAGFSGSPVWDEELGGVVGMVVAAEDSVDSRTAFIVPAFTISDNLPGVLLSRVEQTNLPKKAARVFLCHATADKQAVRKLFRRLSGDGFLPWLDEESLLPGQEWQEEIKKAIHRSDAIVVCLSKHSIVKSGHVQKEIKYALDVYDEKPEGKIFIIPLRLEECQVPERLGMFEWVDYFDETGYEKEYEKLVRSLQNSADYEE